MSESKERKGLFTKKQEVKIDKAIKLKGIAEMIDGPALTILDNQIIERLKVHIPEEYMDELYAMIDELVSLIPEED